MSERSVRSKSGRAAKVRASVVVPALCLMLGIVLVGMAVPRTLAAWESMKAQPVLLAFQVGKEQPQDAELAAAIAALSKGLAWHSTANRLADLAQLEVAQALRLEPNDPHRAAILKEAEKHLLKAAVANPADGYVWYRLALVRDLRGARSRDVSIALMQSIDVAPNVHQLWIPRAELLFAYWQSFTPDELLSVRNQLRAIWTATPLPREEPPHQPLARLAVRYRQLALLGWSLGADPILQAQLRTELEKVQAESKR